MIENGKRVPSERLLADRRGHLSKRCELGFMTNRLRMRRSIRRPARSAVSGLPLEPGIPVLREPAADCYSGAARPNRHNGTAICSLVDSRTPGIQPATVSPTSSVPLKASAAKRFPLTVSKMCFDLAADVGLASRFSGSIKLTVQGSSGDTDVPLNTMVRSFLRCAKQDLSEQCAHCKTPPARLKFDVANHIAHIRSCTTATAHELRRFRVVEFQADDMTLNSPNVDAKDILYRLARFRMQLFRRRTARPKNAVPAVPRQSTLMRIEAGDKD